MPPRMMIPMVMVRKKLFVSRTMCAGCRQRIAFTQSVEEEVLERLSESDQLEERRQEIKRELEENESIYSRREEEVSEVVQGLDKQIDQFSQEREKLTVDVDPQHLTLYERILERNKNSAISVVRDSICQGCFMTVTSQNVTLLMLGRDLVQCRNCSRLLYIE